MYTKCIKHAQPPTEVTIEPLIACVPRGLLCAIVYAGSQRSKYPLQY